MNLMIWLRSREYTYHTNYEAYLGKEFINVDKLSELNSIMKSDSADTIAQALAVYNNRH